MTASPRPRRRRRPWRTLTLALRGDALGIVALLLAYAVFGAYAVATGMAMQHFLLATLAVAFLHVLPGALIWRAIRPREGWLLEDLAFGFASGFVLSVIAQSVGGVTGQRALSVLIPLGVAAILLMVPSTRRRIVAARWTPTPAWLGVVTALATVGAVPGLTTYARQNRVAWTSGFSVPQVDQYFQLAMVQQLLNRGPAGWPLLTGENLGYHWFTHAWMANVSAASGTPPVEVLLRFAPVLSPFLVVASVAALGLRATGRPLVAGIAVVVTMLGGAGSFWGRASLSAPLTPESPTLALSVPPLLALVAVLVMRWQKQSVRWGLPALMVLAVAASGTKGSATPLVIAGAALAAAAMALWRRTSLPRVVVDLAALIVALLFTMTVVFRGSANALLFDPAAAVRYSWPVAVTGSTGILVMLVGGATLVFSGLTRAAPAFAVAFRDSERDGRRDPVLWLLIGGAVAGACAPAVFVQPGASQFYFLLSAIPLAALGTAIAVDAMREHLGSRWLAVVGVAMTGGILAWVLPPWALPVGRQSPGDMIRVPLLGALVFAATAVAARCTIGRRTPAAAVTLAMLTTGALGALATASRPNPAVAGGSSAPRPKTVLTPGAIGAGQVAAAKFIGRESSRGDVVMTNRHCTSPDRTKPCDSRYFTVAAHSGRQMLVEGWGYSPTITAMYPKGRESITAPFWDSSLLELNDGFYTAPSASAASALWSRGVRWVYVDTALPHEPLTPYATLRYENSQAQVWQLRKPR